MKDLVEKINSIRNDRTHGAGELSRRALEILREAAQENRSPTTASFLEEMEFVCRELIAARPSMVIIASSVGRFRCRLMEYTGREKNIEALRSFAVRTAAGIMEEISSAKEKAVAAAAGLLADGTRMVTCSYSSTILQVLEQAAREKRFPVTVLESRFGAYSYGEITACRLREKGINCRVIPDDRAREAVAEADLILVGADAVLADGSLVNGYPTLELATAAAERHPRVPFYAVCESLKFHPGGAIILEEGFQLIPSRMIKGIICEEGIIDPGRVAEYSTGTAAT